MPMVWNAEADAKVSLIQRLLYDHALIEKLTYIRIADGQNHPNVRHQAQWRTDERASGDDGVWLHYEGDFSPYVVQFASQAFNENEG